MGIERAPQIPRQRSREGERLRRSLGQGRRQRDAQDDADGRLTPVVTVTASLTLEVHHHLGREPKGVQFVHVPNSSAASNRIMVTAWNNETVTLFNSSATDQSVRLRVF